MADIVEFLSISKRFPGTVALDSVSFAIAQGEIHAIVGANGAGKSTLMNILGGTLRLDEGTVLLQGEPVSIRDPHHARELGISVVYQELRLCDNLSVVENMVLGRKEFVRLSWVQQRAAMKEAERALALISVDIDPATKVGRLSISQKQLVEIAKAIASDCRVLILDEPTSSLTVNESQILFENLRTLRSRGATIIFISHRLDEVFAISERISVLRDGRYLGTFPVAEITRDKIVELIAGKSLVEELSRHGGGHARGEIALEVRGLSRGTVVHDVSFQLYQGEILGLYGLQGAGRTELLECLFGLARAERGEIYFRSARVEIRRPADAIRHGVVMVPEDRRRVGLFLSMDVKENICIAIPGRISKAWILLRSLVQSVAAGFVQRIGIKVTGLSQKVATLSGGNQQKVIISRWLATEPTILLLDEVTRGVDVGAKAEIYRTLRALRDKGLSILLVSSELPEIVAECDRTLVMWSGKLVADLDAAEIDGEKVLSYAMGLSGTLAGHGAT